MRRVLVFACVSMCAGCTQRPGDGALGVVVKIGAGAVSRCVRVQVTPASGNPRQSNPMVVGSKTSLEVAVFQDGLSSPVTVEALGYSDEGCSLLSSDRSTTTSAAFEPGKVTRVSVELTAFAGDGGTDGGSDGGEDGGLDGGIDDDHDGYPVPADCDDADPFVNPGQPEQCRNTRDDNCDGQIDCQDTACAGAACGPLPVATPGVCSGRVCVETVCDDGLDNNGLRGADCADSDCDSRPCQLGGTCTGGICASVAEVCSDRVDNNGNGLIDCQEASCAGQACNDGDPCTLGESCAGTVCTGGTPKSCTTTAACYLPAGSCNPSTGDCVFTADAGASCVDGRACTANDRCLADGGCAGTYSCTTPPNQCSQGGGCAVDGTCLYVPRSGACDDTDNCTVNDTCLSDAGCAGTRVSCPAAECQTFAGTCTGAGACQYTMLTGPSCDGGWGSCASGVCQRNAVDAGPVFPYTPSNFTQTQLPATNGTVNVTINCPVTLDTGVAGGGFTMTGSCVSGPLPPSAAISGAAGEVLLIAMDSLTVSNTLTVIGSRPLIIGVRGTGASAVNISGTIDLTGASAGAGADPASPACVAANPGGTPSGQPGGGAAGGAYGGTSGNGGSGVSGGGVLGGGAVGTAALVPLRGGCSGGRGGNSGGAGGAAGGAIQLSVIGGITIAGSINAGGQGGRGGSTGSDGRGGGGGGSGGAILLEAGGVISVPGSLAANGGGGGEGSDNNGGGRAGADGAIGTSVSLGGTGGSGYGGAGGPGGARAAGAGNGGTASTGGGNHGAGGGGGGSVGRIQLRAGSCSLSNAVSPQPAASSGSGC